jgi:hypothetical protein
VANILKKFGTNTVKPINIPFAFHCKLSSVLYPINEEENGYMSRVSYSSRKFDVCDETISISHVVCVVSRHMEKPSEEHGNGC